jgi:hypothetical protein
LASGRNLHPGQGQLAVRAALLTDDVIIGRKFELTGSPSFFFQAKLGFENANHLIECEHE